MQDLYSSNSWRFPPRPPSSSPSPSDSAHFISPATPHATPLPPRPPPADFSLRHATDYPLPPPPPRSDFTSAAVVAQSRADFAAASAGTPRDGSYYPAAMDYAGYYSSYYAPHKQLSHEADWQNQ